MTGLNEVSVAASRRWASESKYINKIEIYLSIARNQFHHIMDSNAIFAPYLIYLILGFDLIKSRIDFFP
jgi:hypothetical protein